MSPLQSWVPRRNLGCCVYDRHRLNPWAHAGIKICQGVTILQWWNIHMHFSSPCLTLSFLIHGNDRILIHCGKHLYCLLTLSSLTCGNNQLRSHYLSRIVPSYILNYVYSKSNFGKNHSLHQHSVLSWCHQHDIFELLTLSLNYPQRWVYLHCYHLARKQRPFATSFPVVILLLMRGLVQRGKYLDFLVKSQPC